MWKPCTTEGKDANRRSRPAAESSRKCAHAAGELVLGDVVDGIDVIDDLDLVEVALMHQVEANPVRATLGHGLRRSPIGAGVERVESLAPSTRA